jgi:hypothetical protein
MNKNTPLRIAAVIAAVALAVPLRVAPSLALEEGAQSFMVTRDEVQSTAPLECRPDDTQTEPFEAVDLPSSDATELSLNECIAACKAGGSTMTAYCATMPTAQLKTLCYTAALVGGVTCVNFCYARFVD